MTFSIIGRDGVNPEGAEWGVAVASKFLAVGSIVPWAQAGAGAVATHALTNIAYGPNGLRLLSFGRDAAEVVASHRHRKGSLWAIGRSRRLDTVPGGITVNQGVNY